MSESYIESVQRSVCAKYSAEYCPARRSDKLGIAENVRTGSIPIHGLRHLPTRDTSGWFVWAGEEISSDPDYFKPLHIAHLDE